MAKDDDQILGVTRSGLVITEKVAEEMAEEIEREPPDPSELKREYVGRRKILARRRSLGHPALADSEIPEDEPAGEAP